MSTNEKSYKKELHLRRHTMSNLGKLPKQNTTKKLKRQSGPKVHSSIVEDSMVAFQPNYPYTSQESTFSKGLLELDIQNQHNTLAYA